MSLTKDEVVKMAREAGAIISPQWGVASNIGTATFERFATLCRAPLVAENEAQREQLKALGVYNESTKARALKAEQAGAAAYWSEVIGMFEARLNQGPAAVTASDVLALLGDCQYLASLGHPQPAAQEPTSAVPVVEQFLQDGDQHLLHSFIETTEDDEGYMLTKPEIKRLAELGVVQSHGFGKYSVTMFGHWVHERYWHQNPSLPLKTNTDRTADAALAAGQQYLKENGK